MKTNSLGLLLFQFLFVFGKFFFVLLRLLVGRRLLLVRSLSIGVGVRQELQDVVIVGQTTGGRRDPEKAALRQLDAIDARAEFEGVVVLRDSIVDVDLHRIRVGKRATTEIDLTLSA